MEADRLQASPMFGRSLGNVQHLLMVYKSILGMQCAAQAAAQEAEKLQQQEDALQRQISRAEEQTAQAAQASTKLEATEQVCQFDLRIKLPDKVPLWGINTAKLCLDLTLPAWALRCCWCACGEDLYGTCTLALQAVRRLTADLQLHQRAARQATLEAERLQSLHQQLQELQAACQGSRAPGGGLGACLTEQLDSARRALSALGCI